MRKSSRFSDKTKESVIKQQSNISSRRGNVEVREKHIVVSLVTNDAKLHTVNKSKENDLTQL